MAQTGQPLSPRQRIAQLDRQVDANRRALLARESFDQQSWRAWGYAWRKHPDLQVLDRELFRQRGEAQVARDLTEEQRLRSAGPASRTKKCPACRGTGRTLTTQVPV